MKTTVLFMVRMSVAGIALTMAAMIGAFIPYMVNGTDGQLVAEIVYWFSH